MMAILGLLTGDFPLEAYETTWIQRTKLGRPQTWGQRSIMTIGQIMVEAISPIDTFGTTADD
jgi:hypothetical protein